MASGPVDAQFPIVEAPLLTMITATDRPSIINQPQKVRFEASTETDGFFGRYDLVYTWRLS